mmetsp:Transcript_85681/g.239432  ORF Transcript_85681/g.239432 Transcript_85681/m.239432 type:complete len:246 (+) Transcript_85681:501-1238(+)
MACCARSATTAGSSGVAGPRAPTTVPRQSTAGTVNWASASSWLRSSLPRISKAPSAWGSSAGPSALATSRIAAKLAAHASGLSELLAAASKMGQSTGTPAWKRGPNTAAKVPAALRVSASKLACDLKCASQIPLYKFNSSSACDATPSPPRRRVMALKQLTNLSGSCCRVRACRAHCNKRTIKGFMAGTHSSDDLPTMSVRELTKAACACGVVEVPALSTMALTAGSKISSGNVAACCSTSPSMQ